MLSTSIRLMTDDAMASSAVIKYTIILIPRLSAIWFVVSSIVSESDFPLNQEIAANIIRDAKPAAKQP